jgi:uncharacterized membrane protein YgdD (TMEM256/DUF423 family)
MHRGFIKTGSILAALSIVLGAFAAHKMKGLVSDNAVEIFETGVRYQLYHSFALFIVAIIFRETQTKWLKIAGWLFIAGILLFSGSLYVLAFAKAAVSPDFKWVGPITPVGGLCFSLGWIFVFVAVFAKRRTS